ncbi:MULTISPECIES: hypothetical protein [unclassified Methylobacterium]|uniref:hypothetical protein n=1 Tax=unclassified Methylobacterium TaxID=2615210 RepID=UPI00226A0B1B|nr:MULTISPECIES: hypothetical protein [unclassified Methylobacterium]
MSQKIRPPKTDHELKEQVKQLALVAQATIPPLMVAKHFIYAGTSILMGAYDIEAARSFLQKIIQTLDDPYGLSD